MRKLAIKLFMLLGWGLFFLILLTSIIFDHYSIQDADALFQPISWTDHQQIIQGALICTLGSKELRERQEFVKNNLFPNLLKKDDLVDGFVYYFDDTDETFSYILEFVKNEKQCCPFFKFDISVLPFKKGLALKLSGGNGVKEFLSGIEDAIEF